MKLLYHLNLDPQPLLPLQTLAALEHSMRCLYFTKDELVLTKNTYNVHCKLVSKDQKIVSILTFAVYIRMLVLH